MNLFVMIKPVKLDELYATALQSNEGENLLKVSAPLVRMFQDLRDWSDNNGARVLNEFGEFFCLTIAADKVDEFAQFNKKWEMTAKTRSAVGIGGTPLEAFMAMESSESRNGESIVLYSDDLEDGMDEGVIDLGLSKAEDPFSFPNLNLDEQEPQEQQSQPKPQEDSVKQKVVQALMLVKQNAALIGQLRETNPDAYQAIKGLVDAMLDMAKQGQPEQQQQAQKSEDSLPIGTVKDGRIKVEDKDPYTGQPKGNPHWHRVLAGMVRGIDGHPVGSQHENAKTEENG
jgi:hypothetical protein